MRATQHGTTQTRARVLNAPVMKVWEAWTQPDHLVQWLSILPASTSLDLHPGGSWHTTLVTRDGSEYPMWGTYQEVTNHRRLAYTMHAPDSVDPTLYDVTFTDLGNQTRIVLTQTSAPDKKREKAPVGCDMTLEQVSAYLATI